MKSHLQFQEVLRIEPLLFVNGIAIMDIKCTLFEKRKISPRRKAFWNSIFNDIDWQRAWLLPYKFCITNKIKQVHIQILHNIYVTNLYLSKFLDIENKCLFCNGDSESLTHLFYHCSCSLTYLLDSD